MFSPILLLPLLACFLSSVLAISPVTIKGSRFFNSDGSQFYIKGVAYQPSNSDPLANPSQCSLDAKLMQTLGVNAIRVYHVDASSNHQSCMSTFAAAGIYTLIDLDTFTTYIIPQGGSKPQWTQSQYSAFQAVMDEFQQYDNVLAFFVANELLTTAGSSVAAPYIKAAARDMKAYRDAKGYRDIAVGYSAADVAVLRPNLQNYLACGGNASDAVDFYSLNSYEWCGESSYTQSGYNILEQNATGYPIPIFFSETGCNQPEPRTFQDQAAILGPEMDDTWSGAIIYEWTEFTNNFGLISYGPMVAATATGTSYIDGYPIAGTPTPISPDFPELSSQWATLNPTGTSSDDYTPAGTTPVCPPFTAGAWSVSGNVPLPTLGEKFASQSKVQATAKVSSATGSGGAAASGGSSSSSSSSAGSGGAAASSTGKKSVAAGAVVPPVVLGPGLLTSVGLAVGVFVVALAL